MTSMLTEGDLDRGQAPDLQRLRAVAALAPHMLDTDWLWNDAVDWAARHGERATRLLVEHLYQAREYRAAGRLPDRHTMASWALTHARDALHRERR